MKIAKRAFENSADSRGDISLADDTLPEIIGQWRKLNFTPAVPANKRPVFQSWCSHSWKFHSSLMSAQVSFDQENWSEWHELSVCYQMQGWTLVSRRLVPELTEPGDWPVVLAEFERPNGLKSILAFSLFREGALPVHPPASKFSDLVYIPESGIVPDIQNRLQTSDKQSGSPFAPDRHLQCQVFMAYQGQLDAAAVDEILSLHMTSREFFRQAWLTQTTKYLDTLISPKETLNASQTNSKSREVTEAQDSYRFPKMFFDVLLCLAARTQ